MKYIWKKQTKKKNIEFKVCGFLKKFVRKIKGIYIFLIQQVMPALGLCTSYSFKHSL